MKKLRCGPFLFFYFLVLSAAFAQQAGLPYSPSLDLASIDKSIDPCDDFYQYSCGGWQKRNPVPPSETSWSVYAKLSQDNFQFLRALLEESSRSKKKDPLTQKIGDFYGACMDQPEVDRRGFGPIKAELDTIARLRNARDLPPVLADLQLVYGSDILFAQGSTQDPDNSEQQIPELDQGGLGMPDRDYYLKEDAKSQETGQRYLRHVQKIFELIGENPDAAKKDAATVMRVETRMAKASLTRVQRRDPYNLKHKMRLPELAGLAPNFDWKFYYRRMQYPAFEILNVDTPDFFKEVSALLASEPVETWKTYLRFHVADAASPYLSSDFVQENFDFYRKYLRGAEELQPRWKRCVQYVNHNLDDALGQVYVQYVFSPKLKEQTLDMVKRIEDAMGARLGALDWMGPETKSQALAKLHGIRNKIGYPDKWRDYTRLAVYPGEFTGNIQRAHIFESRRQINKVGKPVDRGEWLIPATTVDAYYDSQMNDINFPAGVLQPPLYDPRMDQAPNYGDTGGTIGHELTHGFDDEGSQFDAKGNLRNWWTKEDRAKFEERTQCIADQYAGYTVVDEVHINSKLTLGEDVADLGGEILALMAWRSATKNESLHPIDGYSPEQRFFIGFAQWACANERPENLRVRAMTDPHSPPKYRINGVVANMPEFAAAFSCKAGSPMTKPPDKICKIW